MTDRIMIVAACRTPQGRLLGSLSKFSAADLGVAAGKAALEGIDPQTIDRVIVGHVIGAGQKLNVARQISLRLNIPIERPAFTINMACASGMLAVSLAVQAIRAGDAQVVLCGGTESMSNAPYLLHRARQGYKLGDGKLVDSILNDGLQDAISGEHMALTAERLAREYSISRQMQDQFALQSQQRVATAMQNDVFADELVTVGKLERDEHPRAETTYESLASLRPVFDQKGTITAGNASGLNDASAMLIVTTQQAAQRHGYEPLAIITGTAEIGCDPKRMGLGPVYATQMLCEKLKQPLDQFDTLELNEAFAAQALACCHDLKLDANAPHLNPHGGAIALGHPVGATGARLITHLAHLIKRKDAKNALASLCVGGGMGAAIALEAAE
ncbi:MAG: thiolase family protein [Phycisphaeraceae bacterium]|nr:thiolase family protein [Phycisphaeraceae bacterium]